ncbi:MAG: hypothetical protein ACE5FD_01735, partial [Anaerolineae bacterium]
AEASPAIPTQTTPTPAEPPTAVSPATPPATNAIQRAIAAAEAPTKPGTAAHTAPIQPATIETTSLQNLSDDGWRMIPRITPTQPAPTAAVPAPVHALRRAPISSDIKEQLPDAGPVKYDAPHQQQTSAYENMSTIPIVQRTETDTVPLPDSVVEMEDTSEPTPDNVDMDKLAHEVYSQIRRRLAVEWERGRGKR